MDHCFDKLKSKEAAKKEEIRCGVWDEKGEPYVPVVVSYAAVIGALIFSSLLVYFY